MDFKESNLIEHLEFSFGRIAKGWTSDEWSDSAIQVVEFTGGTIQGISVFSTLGVSGFPLQSPVSEKKIRQELFVMIRDNQVDARFPAILDQVARDAVRSDRPLLRGDVLEKTGTIYREFVAVYCTLPIYYPEKFWTFPSSEGDIVFCWLVPLRKAEVDYVRDQGWKSFESVLDSAKFDLFDVSRPNLV